MKNKRLPIILLIIVLLLLIPFIAMQFTSEVNWDIFDFIVAAVLLISTGLAAELILRNIKPTGYRIAACTAVLVAFFLLWAELAVGIFGSRFAGN